MSRIKGITVQIGAETTGLSKALADVNKQGRDIQKELRDVEKLLKFDPKNTELLAQKQQLLGDAVGSTREKLDRLKAAQEQVNEQFKKGQISDEQYRAFNREVQATEERLKYLQKELGKTRIDFEAMGKSVQEVGKKMESAGKTLTKTVTAPILGIGAAAGKASIDFESAFAGVIKTVDATDEELDELRTGIREMAKEIPVAATEIAGVAEAAGQLGIEVPNIMEFTRVMSDLGVATNMSSDEAATALARLANITQMPQTEFSKLGSSIVALGNNLATTESEIVHMGLRLAAQGKQVGMTEAQILALAGTMSSLGIEAEAGGTAMTMVMKKIHTAVAQGGDALTAFAAAAGTNSEAFAQAWRSDPIQALDMFTKGLNNLSEQGYNLTEVMGLLGITGIRESDAILRMAGASDILADAVELSTDAWEENIALTNEAEQRYGTTESQLIMLWNKLKDVAITVGDVLVPAFMKAIDAAQPFINVIVNLANGFANLDPGMQSVIITIAAIAAAIGPVLIVFGKLATGVGAAIKVFGALTAAAPALGAALTALTGPIGLVIGAVAALAAGVYLVIKHWDSIKDFFSRLWNWMIDFFKKWGVEILVVIAPFIGIPLLIFKHFDTIKDFFSNLWKSVTNVFSNAYNAMKDIGKNIIQGLVDGIKNMAKNAADAAKNVAKSVGDSIKGFFGIKSPSRLMIEYGENIGEGLSDGIKSQVNSVKRAANNLSTAANPASQSASLGMAGGGGYGTANIIVELDSRALVRALGQPLVEQIRVTTGVRI